MQNIDDQFKKLKKKKQIICSSVDNFMDIDM